MTMQPGSPQSKFATLTLAYPMSLGVFDDYDSARKAVDALAEKDFPVQNVLIVGTELKQLERVTGRLTWAKVLIGGALSGLWLGLFVGLIFSLFGTQASPIALLLSTALYGLVFGVIWSAIGFMFTKRLREFSSVSQVVATKYEVFAEHKVAEQARQLLREAGLVAGFGAPAATAPVSSESTPPMPPTPPSAPSA